MSQILSTTTGTGANLSSEIALGADYTADADRIIVPSLRLSSLNGAAASFTVIFRHKTSGGTMLGEDYGYIAKRTATDTAMKVFGNPIGIKSGEKMETRVISSNASDTSVAWERNIFDAQYVADVAGVTPAPASTALTNVTWTDAKAAFIDVAISSRSTYAGGAVASVTAPVTLTGAYDAAKTAASQASVDAIALNTDAKTSDAIAAADSAATQATAAKDNAENAASFAESADTKLGTPVVTVSADIAAIGTGELTQQQIRDAMKLAPTAGAAATNSIDDKIDSVSAGVGIGTGDIPVDHDYGGTDNLRVLESGVPVDNAIIRAYLTADYAAGTFNVAASQYTGSDGRFLAPMMLDAGDYTLVVSKPGVIQDKAVQIAVA